MSNEKIKSVLGPLGELYGMPGVMEIMIDGPRSIYFAGSEGIRDFDGGFGSDAEVLATVRGLFQLAGRDLDKESPNWAECRLSDGTSVIAAFPPVAMKGPAFILRKLPDAANAPTWEKLVEWKCVTPEGVGLLKKIVGSGANMMVAGNAGSGRTTVLSLLIRHIRPECRLVTIERTASLVFDRPRTVRLESPRHRPEGVVELIEAVSRMRADHVVVSDLQGPETMALLDLMRDGHSVMVGTTAEDSLDALARLELKCMGGKEAYGLSLAEIRAVVASAVDFVVFQQRSPKDGRRRIVSVARLESLDGDRFVLTPLYAYDPETDGFVLTEEGKKLGGSGGSLS